MSKQRNDKALTVERVIAEDRWGKDGGVTHEGPWTLRWREPVLGRHAVTAYAHCLQIVWPYAAEGAKAPVDAKTNDELVAFEASLRATLEHDALAVLTAVLTFDGARQWVFYTRDVAACEARVRAAGEGAAPRPIEIDLFEDRGWDFLRDEILGGGDD